MASRKPQFLLESTPVKYERYMTQRYLSNENIDEYRQQRVLSMQAGINATQTMEPWGGQFYGTTQLGFLRTFGEQNQNQFMTIPIAVGYKQDLLFYNPLKWARRIEPLKMARAEKELLYGIETTSEKAVEKFFALALAQDMVQMAMESLASSDTIYAIAQRRYKIKDQRHHGTRQCPHRPQTGRTGSCDLSRDGPGYGDRTRHPLCGGHAAHRG